MILANEFSFRDVEHDAWCIARDGIWTLPRRDVNNYLSWGAGDGKLPEQDRAIIRGELDLGEDL